MKDEKVIIEVTPFMLRLMDAILHITVSFIYAAVYFLLRYMECEVSRVLLWQSMCIFAAGTIIDADHLGYMRWWKKYIPRYYPNMFHNPTVILITTGMYILGAFIMCPEYRMFGIFSIFCYWSHMAIDVFSVTTPDNLLPYLLRVKIFGRK